MALRRGIPFVVSGPSGAGKSTVLRLVLDADPRLAWSVSHTTRRPREGEVDGEDYYFVEREEFEKMIAEDAFLEWAEYNDNLYGTSRASIERGVADGQDIILEIEIQGAAQLREHGPDEAVFIFIEPPSMDLLGRRLRERGTEADEIVGKRLALARQEMEEAHKYHHRVVNDELPRAVVDLQGLIEIERQNAGSRMDRDARS